MSYPDSEPRERLSLTSGTGYRLQSSSLIGTKLESRKPCSTKYTKSCTTRKNDLALWGLKHELLLSKETKTGTTYQNRQNWLPHMRITQAVKYIQSPLDIPAQTGTWTVVDDWRDLSTLTMQAILLYRGHSKYVIRIQCTIVLWRNNTYS